MGLSVALDVARSKLAVTAEQTAVVARNVQNSSDPNAKRKLTGVATGPGGSVHLTSVTRATNQSLYTAVLNSTASQSGQSAIVDSLNQIESTIMDPQLDASPQALIGKLRSALQLYSTNPSNPTTGQAAVSAAKDLANGLNDATATVQGQRTQADRDIANSVSNINKLLGQFQTINTKIVQGNLAGSDVTDYQDQRDQILTDLSQEIGIKTLDRGNGDLAITTESGVTLFDKSARSVDFDPVANYSAGARGNAIFVDGVPVVGGGGPMTVTTGRIAGLVEVRDNVAVTYQNQLDEIARGLVTKFSEQDQSGGGQPDVPGLFTWSGSPAIPTSGTLTPGIAATIQVAASVDPTQGGNINLMRDGAISGNSAYNYNTTGNSGFNTRLNDLVAGLDQPMSFDAVAGVDTNTTLTQFASSSAGWFEQQRTAASSQSDYQNTLKSRATDALNKVSGISIDEEMSNMLDLEKAYNATSKVISTIDSMYTALLQAI